MNRFITFIKDISLIYLLTIGVVLFNIILLITLGWASLLGVVINLTYGYYLGQKGVFDVFIKKPE